jgi:hypothetical protein
MAELNDLNQMAEHVADLAKEATYLVVGLGVLGVQRAQVRRRELSDKLHTGEVDLEDALSGVKTEVIRRVGELDGLVDEALTFVESNIEPLGEQLPQPAVDLAHRALSGAREVQTQVRNLVGSAS